MKTMYSRLSAVVAMILTLAVLLSVSAGALSVQTFTVELTTPITFTSTTRSPTQAEVADAQKQVATIVQAAVDAFLYDYPLEAIWIDVAQMRTAFGYSTGSWYPPYRWTIDELEATVPVLAEFTDPDGMTEAIRDVVEGFVPYGETRYEKLLSFQRYLCALVTYDLNGTYAHNAFGSLIDYRAVCEGYAEAFKMLCDVNGIPCIIVSGTAHNGTAEGAHMWNYVKMEDGNWYAVDVTWDDQYRVMTNYFLVGSKTEVASGVSLEENHFPDGDLNNSGLKIFALPTLSENSYLANQEGASPVAAEGSADKTWYYDQLNEDQKALYHCLLALVPEAGEYPTVNPGETDAWTSDEVTEAPETESVESDNECSHAEGEWTVTVPPVGFEAGEKAQICTACGETLATEVIYNTFGLGDEGNTDKVLIGIFSEVTSDELKEHYSSLGYDVTITDMDGNETDVVGTGTKVTVGGETYEVVIKGDITGDGVIDIFDLSSLLSGVNGEFELEGVFKKAGLIVNEEEPDIFDLTALLSHVNGDDSIDP
ncbi:MAG: hypothetical protein IJD10_04790 [Clostridia bacterium]|nr:hypothetical protein [Clostridia bacterium]